MVVATFPYRCITAVVPCLFSGLAFMPALVRVCEWLLLLFLVEYLIAGIFINLEYKRGGMQ